MRRTLWASSALLLLSSSVTLHAEQLSQHLTTIVDPKPLVRVAPKYPINAAKSKREGWTKLSFVIDVDGKVSDVLVKESSGSKDLDKASIKAVLEWEYQPALENGKPIEQCANTVQLNYKMKGEASKGVSRKFFRLYKQAQEALNTQQYDEVELLLTKMSALKYRHLTENNYMHILAYNYQKTQKAPLAQLHHLSSITYSALDDDLQFSLLKERFILQVDQSQFKQARRTYNRLNKLEPAQEQLPLFKNALAQISTLIESDADLVQNADIGTLDFWYAPLIRNQFSLMNVEGSLTKLDVRCANKRHVYSIEENNTWTLPDSWNGCSIYVYGADNTRFNLVEHATKA